MLPRLGLGAALFATTQAILLPPGVSLERLNDDDVPMEISIVDPFTRLVPVPCVGCPYAKAEKHGLVWVDGVENSLLLNISVGEQPETLELNGFRLYPPPTGLMMNPSMPAIPQVPANIPLGEIMQNPSTYLEHPLRVEGWSFEAGSSLTASDSGDEVLTMRMHISLLEGHPVSVPDVAITALKRASDAKLMILAVKAEDASSIPQTPEAQREKECHDWPVLCNMKAMLAAKLAAMKNAMSGLGHKVKGCHKHKFPGSASAGAGGGMMLHRPATNLHHGLGSHHDGAGGMHHQQPHHHSHQHKHHTLHRVLHAVGRVASAIFVPVIVGIAVGFATYHVGMLIGCLAALAWYKLHGSPSRRGQYAVVLGADADEEAPPPPRDEPLADYSEKEVVAAEDGEEAYEVPPPVYSEEVVEKEVVQE